MHNGIATLFPISNGTLLNFNGFTDGAPGYLLTVSKHIQSAYLDFQLLCDGHKQDFTLSKVKRSYVVNTSSMI
jgi:hypothetical protein